MPSECLPVPGEAALARAGSCLSEPGGGVQPVARRAGPRAGTAAAVITLRQC